MSKKKTKEEVKNKIQSITLKNFKAFYGEQTIKFNGKDGKKGKNVLIYGENGSGKSSLARALEVHVLGGVEYIKKPFILGKSKLSSGDTLIRSTKNLYQNLKSLADDEFFVEIQVTDKKTTNIDGYGDFLDYKKLSDIHYQGGVKVALNTIFDGSQESHLIPRILDILFSDADVKTTYIQQLDLLKDDRKKPYNESDNGTALVNFQKLLNNEKINDFVTKVDKILKDFFDAKNTIKLSEIKFQINTTSPAKALGAKYISLEYNVECQGLSFKNDKSSLYLNEAKLSAISLAIYFALLQMETKQNAAPNALNILILDDALTGLEMSNRLPVVKILKEHFDGYQIFFLTHDREFYERIGAIELKGWKKIEMYEGHDEQNESIFVPVVIETEKDFNPIDKANKYFRAHDYPASANYLRKAFEAWVNDLLPKPATQSKSGDCVDKEKKKPGLEDKINELSSLYSDEHCNFVVEQDKGYYVDKLEKLKKLRTLILNPASHYDITAKIYKSELESALAFYKKAKADLSKIYSVVSEDVCMLYVPYRLKKGSLLCYQFKKTIEREGLDPITVTYDAQYELVDDTWLHLNIEKQKYIDEKTKLKTSSCLMKVKDTNGKELYSRRYDPSSNDFTLGEQLERVKFGLEKIPEFPITEKEITQENIKSASYTIIKMVGHISSCEELPISVCVNFTK